MVRMKFYSILCVLVSIAALGSANNFVRWINQNHSTWTARENFPEDVSPNSLKRLNGIIGLHPDPQHRVVRKNHRMTKTLIPDRFDAREAWPFCSDVIGDIRNQGNCGSCWAFASAEVMSDRLCIETKGAVKFRFSPEDLLECCNDCVLPDKCGGGYALSAWYHFILTGVVSGGDYNSQSGCKPYSDSAFYYTQVPNCKQECQRNYQIPYTQDKKNGVSVYVVYQQIEQIQIEIMTNGPVVAIYEVYEDFYNYQSGVYRYIFGPNMGNHAVKIIGWGTENGTPYWLVANSWGREWGGLGGFFKILRGYNHCGIEQYVIAGKSSF